MTRCRPLPSVASSFSRVRALNAGTGSPAHNTAPRSRREVVPEPAEEAAEGSRREVESAPEQAAGETEAPAE